MSFFDRVVGQLFPDKSKKNEILLHEPIKRSTSYLEDYNIWCKSFKRLDLMNAVYNAYELKKQNISSDLDVHLLTSKSSNGFAVAYNQELMEEEFTYLFDWLGEKTKQLNYKRMNSDLMVTAKNDQVETVSKYYFKPRKDFQNPKQPFDQQYGNILIEHISINDKPNYIRYIVNSYNDHQYKKSISFEKLAEFLFNK